MKGNKVEKMKRSNAKKDRRTGWKKRREVRKRENGRKGGVDEEETGIIEIESWKKRRDKEGKGNEKRKGASERSNY